MQEYLSIRYFNEDTKDKNFAFVCQCCELEKLAAMFGVGEIPTSSKDPHGLRRIALNVAGSFFSGQLRRASIKATVAAAVESFDGAITDSRSAVEDFIAGRMQFKLWRDSSVSQPILESIFSQRPDNFQHLQEKAVSLGMFFQDSRINPESKAPTLIAAAKRIKNIFRKSNEKAEAFGSPDPALFSEDAERELWKVAQTLQAETAEHLKQNENDFAAALNSLAAAAEPLEKFFNEVMVNADDKKIRANRFALLAQFSVLLNCVADLSFLSSESGG